MKYEVLVDLIVSAVTGSPDLELLGLISHVLRASQEIFNNLKVSIFERSKQGSIRKASFGEEGLSGRR